MPKKWFGHDVPSHVLQIKVMYVPDIDGQKVYWQTDTGDIHERPFEVNQETVEAVLIAMKLS